MAKSTKKSTRIAVNLSWTLNRLLVFGSRDVDSEKARVIIIDAIVRLSPDEILTAAEPEGVCQIAQDIAKELNIPLVLFFKHLGHKNHRSIQALKSCSFCTFIHNGISQGTANEIKEAVKMGKPHEIIEVECKDGFKFEDPGFKF